MRDSDIAYEKIKMMIITAQLKPGEAVVEARLGWGGPRSARR